MKAHGKLQTSANDGAQGQDTCNVETLQGKDDSITQVNMPFDTIEDKAFTNPYAHL